MPRGRECAPCGLGVREGGDQLAGPVGGTVIRGPEAAHQCALGADGGDREPLAGAERRARVLRSGAALGPAELGVEAGQLRRRQQPAAQGACRRERPRWRCSADGSAVGPLAGALVRRAARSMIRRPRSSRTRTAPRTGRRRSRPGSGRETARHPATRAEERASARCGMRVPDCGSGGTSVWLAAPTRRDLWWRVPARSGSAGRRTRGGHGAPTASTVTSCPSRCSGPRHRCSRRHCGVHVRQRAAVRGAVAHVVLLLGGDPLAVGLRRPGHPAVRRVRRPAAARGVPQRWPAPTRSGTRP